MGVEHEIVDGALRINCLNWAIAPNIEDSEACMAIVIDKLREVKDANRVILAETRENEYDYEQTNVLRSIADAYNRIINVDKILAIRNIVAPGCQEHISQRLSELQFLVLEALRKDPIGAYIKLNTMINHVNKIIDGGTAPDQKCYQHYLTNALQPMQTILDQTSLIKKARKSITRFKFGDRGLYREIFSPVIRPNFMLTRLMMTLPKNGKSLEKYSMPPGFTSIVRQNSNQGN